MKKRNIIEKIWDAHSIVQHKGHPAILGIDLILLHEVTSPQAFQTLEQKGIKVLRPEACLATLDHSIPTRVNRNEIFDASAKNQVQKLREYTKTAGIRLYDFDSGHQGIVHVIAPELGAIRPGMTVVCGDSHTSTHGAFGALAFGIGTTELTCALATSALLMSPSKTMRVAFKGSLRPGVFSKDIILALIAQIGTQGATGYFIEYTGEPISRMSMEERMTICNMSIECGARAGLINPDEVTYRYLKERIAIGSTPEKWPENRNEEWDEQVERWNRFKSDPGCVYDKEICIDLDELEPIVTWGTDPAQSIGVNQVIPNTDGIPEPARTSAKKALNYTKLSEDATISGTSIQWAFIGSCTNGRIEDLRIAASVIKNQKVHPGVTFYIVPGSEQVMKQAREEGLVQIFENAGAIFRMPGCSMCLGMNDDRVPSGQRCISSTNRNFVGRQGPGSITHLASPATVAASAIAGKITSPIPYFSQSRFV